MSQFMVKRALLVLTCTGLLACSSPPTKLEDKLNTASTFEQVDQLRQKTIAQPAKPLVPVNRRHVLIEQGTKDQLIGVPRFNVRADFKSADLTQVIQSLMQVAGYTALLDVGDNAHNRVDLHVRSGAWDQVITHLLMQQGLVAVFDRKQPLVRVLEAPQNYDDTPFQVRAYKRNVPLEQRDEGYFLPQMRTEFIELYHVDPVTTKVQIDLVLGYEAVADGQIDRSPIKVSGVIRDSGSRLNEYTADEKGNPVSFADQMRTEQGLPGLVVTDTAENIDSIVAIVENLDRRIPQVFIEAFIVSVSDAFQRELGSRLALGTNTGALTSSDQVGVVSNLGGGANSGLLSTGLPDAGNIANGSFNLLTNVGIDALRVEIKALEEAGFSRTIANPKIMVINREKGFFRQGEVICWTIVRSEETPATDTTPLQRKTYEVHQCSDGTSSESGDSLPDRQLGLTLEVVPTISYGGDIMLDIGVHQIVADQVSGVRNRPPNTTNMDLTNRMIAQDGEIIVIGGNHALKESNGSSNLPGQKGSKFMGVTSQNDTFKEMLVFLSVRKL